MFELLHDAASGATGYLLADDTTAEAVLIDPRGADVPALRALLADRRLQLRWVLRTHEHDALLLRESSALVLLGAPVIEHRVAAGMASRIVFGSEQLQVLATPGHTASCLSFAWRDRIFCGGLMAADVCPFQPWAALPEALWDSAQRHIFAAPDATLLFSSHGRQARVVSTVLEQRWNHPWFAQGSRPVFLALARAAAVRRAFRPPAARPACAAWFPSGTSA
jgi:glyoxylase-like metal-dependent hydrolase (beta-lactamase superfamily II)